MAQSLIAVAFVIAGWSILARRLQRWHLTAPIVLVAAGIPVGLTIRNSLASTLNTEIALRVVEVILAVLLFLDATDAGGFFGQEPRLAARVLLIVLPLSLGFSVLIGWWLLPHLSWAVLVVIACVVVPTDFAVAPAILRDERVPERVRSLLKVEGGYSDGIISPVFVCAVAVAVGAAHRRTPVTALSMAIPPVIKALVVGVSVGSALAVLANVAERRDLMSQQSQRLLIVVAPVLSYAISVGIAGNGFVAAFVSGIAVANLRRSETFRQQLASADDIGFLLAAVMWFVLGCATVMAVANGVPWRIVVFALLVLTVARLVPVLLALSGSALAWRDRIVMGCLTPRGAPSIVFGLLAFNALNGEAADSTLLIAVLVVVGSIVLHGIGSPALARMYSRSEKPRAPTRSS